MKRQPRWQSVIAAVLAVGACTVSLGAGSAVARQDATQAAASCAAATPMAGMTMGTPMAAMAIGTPAATVEFDQSYIDMMIPHHASILALAEAARPLLHDERLRAIADTIIATQGQEIDELRGARARFYGNPEPEPVDAAAMERLMAGMAMGTPMAEMMAQMDAATQLAAFCAGATADPDLTFIDLTIPHHASAIAASETALREAVHDEIRAFARRVIAAQRREIDDLSAIRRERFGSATPAAVGGSDDRIRTERHPN